MMRIDRSTSTKMRATRLNFRSACAVHITMPPHEPDGFSSVTEPFIIGISYTGHSKAVIDTGASTSECSLTPGTCAISGPTPIRWLRVIEPSEALEIRPSSRELAMASDELGVDWRARASFLCDEFDPVIWAVCTRYRMAACGSSIVTDLQCDQLVHKLLAHVSPRYFGARPLKPIRGRLNARRLARVTALIEGSLKHPPSLRSMAAAAALSPFHFQRIFRATTGLTPYGYVTARRLERARRMLNDSSVTVALVAAELGFSDLAHFRRVYRRQFNRTPREQ